MKPIEELRKEFEENKEIRRKLGLLIRFDSEAEMYYYTGVSIDEFYQAKLNFINGAWFMFQELNK